VELLHADWDVAVLQMEGADDRQLRHMMAVLMVGLAHEDHPLSCQHWQDLPQRGQAPQVNGPCRKHVGLRGAGQEQGHD
jgi:hypothetical protein